MISEQPIPDWDIKLKFKPNKYPTPLDASLPRLYFVSLFIGSRGSGKSYSIVKLLKKYEHAGIVDTTLEGNPKVAQRIVLFSPTADANPVFTALRHLDAQVDTVTSYSNDKLLEVVEDVKAEREETVKYQKQLRTWHKFMKVKDFGHLSHEEVQELEMMGYEEPEPPKYPAGCVTFFVLDDHIGSTAFKATGKSALTNLVLKNRHLGICMLIATQNLKAIPKSIRTNASLFVIFKYANKKVITEDLYEEVSNTLTLERFEEVFEHATTEDHDCLVIDFSQPKEARFKKNFDRTLHVSGAPAGGSALINHAERIEAAAPPAPQFSAPPSTTQPA